MPEKDLELIQALKQAKTKKMFFAFVPKGSEGKLIVAKAKIPPKVIADAKKEISGGTPVTGKCIEVEGTMEFHVAKEQPATLGPAIKKVIKRDTSLAMDTVIKVAADADNETEVGSAPTPVMPPLPGIPKPLTPPPTAMPPLPPTPTKMPPLPPTPKPKASPELKDAVTKRLGAIMNDYKEIAGRKDTEATHMQGIFATFKGHLSANDYEEAAKDLDQLEPLVTQFRTNQATYKKELPVLLKHKADTDAKIARLEKHPQKALIKDDIIAIKAAEEAAMKLAEPPTYDFMGATKALAAVDKSCAAAEVKLLNEATKGMNQADMKKAMQKTFKERFGIELKMEDKGESKEQEYESLRRIYELMAMVPESHTTKNPSLKKIDRIGGDAGGSFYQAKKGILGGLITKNEKKVVLHCTRPRTDGTQLNSGLKKNPAGGFDPPVEADCQPRPGANMKQSYFDWTTLHEIAHAIDDKKGFMKKNGNGDAYGGWTEYGSDSSVAAQAIAGKHNFNTPDALKYIKKLLLGETGTAPAAPTGRTDWAASQKKVEDWCATVRVGKDPWDNMPEDVGGVIHHEAYPKHWVSYKKAARGQAITGYQFRAPGEWFSELYAAYHSGVLKDTHPMVKKFLKDL